MCRCVDVYMCICVYMYIAFVELVSPYNKKNITRWLEDMNFMFEWQDIVLATRT